jgi:hypothetical protein
MNKQILGFLIPMAGLLAITSPAFALTESFGPINYSGLSPNPSGSGNSSTSVSLQQFNPSLGTLNSISLSLANASTTFYFDASNFDFTNSGTAGINPNSVSQLINVNLGTSNLLSGTSSTASGIADTSIAAGSIGQQLNTTGLVGSTINTNSSVLSTLFSQFTGTGTIGLNVVDAQPTFTPSTATLNSTAISISPDSLTSASGSLSVTYTYTAPVPFDISANQIAFSLVPLFFGMRVIKKRWL